MRHGPDLEETDSPLPLIQPSCSWWLVAMPAMLLAALPVPAQVTALDHRIAYDAHAISYSFFRTNRQENWEAANDSDWWTNSSGVASEAGSGTVLAYTFGSSADAHARASGAHSDRIFFGRGLVSANELDPWANIYLADASASGTSETQFVFDLAWPGAYFTLRTTASSAVGNDQSYAYTRVRLVGNPLFGGGGPVVFTGNTSGFLSSAYRYTLRGEAQVSGSTATASYYFSLVVNEAELPGSVPTAPQPPDNVVTTNSGLVYLFNNAARGLWFDPPTADAFRYTMRSNSLFTAILGFPTNFTGPFTVSVSNTVVGSFGVGDTVTFTNFPGGGVNEFTVSGINPAANAEVGFPIRLNFNTATADFAIAPLVPRPVAFAQALVTSEDTPIPITLASTNAAGAVTNFMIVTEPNSGQLLGTFTNLQYWPVQGFHGTDQFTYRALDDFSESESATVTITVVSTNNAPPVLGASHLAPEGELHFTLIGITGRSYEIQVSSNLLDWEPLRTLLNTNGVVTVAEPVLAAETVQRFYRARLLP